MGDTPSLPEFGANGSVLNSDTMTEELRQKYEEGENGFGGRGARTPKVWPLSAIWMICLGSAVAGYAFAKLQADESSLWILTLVIIANVMMAISQLWRHHWEKRQKKRA